MKTIYIYELNKSYNRKELYKELSEFNKTVYDFKSLRNEKSLSLEVLAEMLINAHEEEYGY